MDCLVSSFHIRSQGARLPQTPTGSGSLITWLRMARGPGPTGQWPPSPNGTRANHVSMFIIIACPCVWVQVLVPGGGGGKGALTAQLGRGWGWKPDPVSNRSAHKNYTLSQYTLLKTCICIPCCNIAHLGRTLYSAVYIHVYHIYVCVFMYIYIYIYIYVCVCVCVCVCVYVHVFVYVCDTYLHTYRHSYINNRCLYCAFQ